MEFLMGLNVNILNLTGYNRIIWYIEWGGNFEDSGF